MRSPLLVRSPGVWGRQPAQRNEEVVEPADESSGILDAGTDSQYGLGVENMRPVGEMLVRFLVQPFDQSGANSVLAFSLPLVQEYFLIGIKRVDHAGLIRTIAVDRGAAASWKVIDKLSEELCSLAKAAGRCSTAAIRS
jgi:hypothetical protein